MTIRESFATEAGFAALVTGAFFRRNAAVIVGLGAITLFALLSV